MPRTSQYVQELDAYVGQVLAALDATGASTNTLVIFTSDNGPDEFAYSRLQDCGHASMGTLRGIKNDIWEGGHRVPFIARWPGKVAAGTTNQQVICLVDFMRTVAAVNGTPVPTNAAEDSVSFLPALLGAIGSGRSSLVLESGCGQFGLRSNNWMYIDSSTGDGHNPELEPLWFKASRGYALTNTLPALLYELRGDPAEATSLYAGRPLIVNQLQKQLREARAVETWCDAQSALWTTPGNWLPAGCPAGSDVVFSNAANAGSFTQMLGANFSLNSIILDGSLSQQVRICPGGAFGLTLANGIDMALANVDLTIDAALTLGQSQMWDVRSNHTLTLNGPVATCGHNLTICGSGNTLISNAISGTGILTMLGSGFVTLGGANTFSGGCTVCGAGFLVAGTDQALGPGDVTIPNNSSLQLMPGVTLTNRAFVQGFGGTFQSTRRGALTLCGPGCASFNGPVTLTADTGFYANMASSVLTIGGTISGIGNLTILPGTGTVMIAGMNTYCGSTIVQGKLKLSAGGGRLPAGTALCLANSSAASLDLNGKNQTVGRLSGGGASGGNIALQSGTLTINQGGAGTYSGAVSGTGGLIKTNSGALILAGKSTYTGSTLISGGSVIVNGSLGPTAVTVAGGSLAGTGILSGPVTVERGGSLLPGVRLGTLSISNELTLEAGSAVCVDIDPPHNVSDRVQGLARVRYGGMLSVSNLAASGTLAAGLSFRLFSASSAEGNFNDIRPEPGAGLVWLFDPASGTLRLVPQPTLRLVRAGAGGLVLSWASPGFHLQAQTNSLGLSSNWFDYPGGAASPIFVPLSPSNASLFLRLASP